MKLDEKEILIKQILEFCKVPRKVKQIAEHFKINQNTLRSGYIYKMVKIGTLKRAIGKTLYIKIDQK
jgi:sugar diacid utilization regulator